MENKLYNLKFNFKEKIISKEKMPRYGRRRRHGRRGGRRRVIFIPSNDVHNFFFKRVDQGY